jgi:hypothetical protein
LWSRIELEQSVQITAAALMRSGNRQGRMAVRDAGKVGIKKWTPAFTGVGPILADRRGGRIKDTIKGLV